MASMDLPRERAAPTPSAATSADSRDDETQQLVARGGRNYVAGIRLLTLLPMVVIALTTTDSLHQQVIVGVTMCGLVAWSAVYVRHVAGGMEDLHPLNERNRAIWPTTIDAMLLSGLALGTEALVSSDWLATSSSWLRPFLTFAAVGYQYSTPLPLGLGLAGLVCAASSYGTQAAQPGVPGPDDVVTGVWSFVTVLLARLLWTLVVRAGRRADGLFTAVHTARRTHLVSARIRGDQRAVGNALHDTAASTLLTVGLGLAVGSVEMLRKRAARDLIELQNIDRAGPAGPMIDLGRELRRISDETALDVIVLGTNEVTLPSGPALAMVGASREALQNVERHAGTDLALLRVSVEDGCWRVEIRDHGSGFSPEEVSVSRRGLRGSIHERMASVGGTARVMSQPGQGTAIHLEWHADHEGVPIVRRTGLTEISDQAPPESHQSQEPSEEATRFLLGGLQMAVTTIACVVLLTASLPRKIDLHHPLWPQITAYTVLAMILLSDFALRVARRSWTSRTRPLAIGFAVAAGALSTWTLPPTLVGSASDWAFGTVAWVLLVLLAGRSVPLIASAVAIQALVTIVRLLLPGAPDLDAAVKLAAGAIGTVGFPLAAAAAAAALIQVAADAQRAGALEAKIRADEDFAQQVHQKRHQQFADIQASAEPLLQGLADGTLEATDPEVQRACQFEASRMRRLFAENDQVAEPLVHELREAADVAERRGVMVQFETVGDWATPPAEVRRQLAQGPLWLLTLARDTATMTVIGDGNELSVHAVVEAPLTTATEQVPRPRRDDVVQRIIQYERRTWIEVRWTTNV